MEGNSSQSGSSSSKKPNTAPGNFVASKAILQESIPGNRILLELEEDGFNTPNTKAEELIKNLTKLKYLFALKLLFENPLNQFSPEVLRNSLVALADPTPFDYYEKQSVARLELHLRTWVAILEQICVTPMRLSKELRDRIYNSLAKFAEIHKKTTQVMQEGIGNNYRSDFNQFNQLQNNKEDENVIKKRNYNIDFLLIHLRDTLHILRDDETWFQEILRRTKELLKAALNITPGVLSIVAGIDLPNDNCSILSMLTQLRKGLNFKYPVASYYVDWRIILIIQRNLFNWSGSSKKIISKKFEEMILMEYFWSYLERERSDVADKSILESQSKFDEVSNKLVKVLRDTGSFLNDLTGNEPLALPHTLWFGILDLAQNYIQKSTRKSTYGLCYYLAVESLNKAPSDFIQFKAIEILLHLHNIDNQTFSIIEVDFNQYTQKLNENDSTTDSSEKFQNLLAFVKEKCLEDFNILNDDIGKEKGKGKSLDQNTNLKGKQTSKSGDILEVIVDEMTCPINSEPADQLCVLRCQHILSFNSLKKLKQKKCPECRETIEDSDIRYLPLNAIYKNLYSQFFEAGHILPSIELEDSDQITSNNQHDSDSDNSEVDHMLTKKKKFIKAIKLNSNISLQSIFQIRITKKQHPTYQNTIKELNEKNYGKAEYWCKEFLKTYPNSYSMRCVLAYIYRCLNNYEQAYSYLNEAIELKRKNSIAWYIYGEICFRQSKYINAIDNLERSIKFNAKINNLYLILGHSCLFYANVFNKIYDSSYYDFHSKALKNFDIALQNSPNNYLCLKNCAYTYEKQEKYLNTLEMLDKLLSINKEDSLILCYYGEILSKMGRYSNAILHFTKANIIDPENVHNLIKRAVAHYVLQEYDKALLDLNKAIQLDFSNDLAYYYRGLTYYTTGDINSSILAFKKCIELNPDNNLARLQIYLEDLNNSNNIITKISQISNIKNDISLLFIRCKIYIELEKYEEARLDLKGLYDLNGADLSFIYLLQEYSNFWSYLYEVYDINNNEFTELGIVKKFNNYMFKVKKVYFISNLVNLNNNDYQLQENDSNSLSGQVLNFKGEVFHLSLPKLYINLERCNIIWKINVKKIISADCFVKFTIVREGFSENYSKEHILKYEDLLRLEGLGWIKYIPFYLYLNPKWIQFSIEANKGSIDMQIDYVQIGPNNMNSFQIGSYYFPKMGHLLPFHKDYSNVPEAFWDRYFSRKEMENLLELKDIINN